MKDKEKKITIILCIVLIISIIILVIHNKEEQTIENTVEKNNITEEFVQILEEGTKINTSEQLRKIKQIGIYKFENIQLTEQNNQTLLLADVTNTGNTATDMQLVDITLLNKEEKEIITIGGIIEALEPGESTQFNSSMTLDYTNIYDFKITLK